jgi:tricorn protease-like protein
MKRMGIVAAALAFALLNRAVAQEPKLRATLDAKRYVSRIDFHPDGKFLAAGGQDRAIEIWDLTAGKVVTTLRAPPGFVLDVRYSPDGRLLAAAANESVVVWTTADGKQVAAFEKLDGTPAMIGFSGDGSKLVAACQKDGAIVWDTKTFQEIARLKGDRADVRAVAISPDGKTVAAAHFHPVFEMWNVAEKKVTASRTEKGGFGFKGLSFSPDGRFVTLLSHSDKVELWDVKEAKVTQAFKGHKAYPFLAAFNRDGTILATGATLQAEKSQEVKVWDVSSGKAVASLRGRGSAVAISRDGVLATANNGTNEIHLWELPAHPAK